MRKLEAKYEGLAVAAKQGKPEEKKVEPEAKTGDKAGLLT